MFHELLSRDHEDGRATEQPSRGTAGLVRGVPGRYVAGSDTRGRQEGRPYPWSQQVIHEISGLKNKPFEETDVDMIKVVVVGSGYWGKNLVRNFNALGALAAICDNDPRVLRNLQETYHGVPTVQRFDDLLDGSGPSAEAIAIATPAEGPEPSSKSSNRWTVGTPSYILCKLWSTLGHYHRWPPEHPEH